MKPLKRCKMKDGANVLLIDIEDDDDVILVDSPESLNLKKGESSEQRENRRVSPQSVIRIEDDDENESYVNHLSAHDGEGFAEFESDATSFHRSRCPYGNPRDARSDGYHFGNDEYEYEPIEIDSDCEVMEDSSGKVREQWEKAANQKKVNRHKANFGPEGRERASGSNSSAVRKKNMTEPFSENLSCSNANVPFTNVEIPSTFNVVNEENNEPYDQDTLFPEFDWRNLGGRSSFKNPVSSDTGEGLKENSNRMVYEFISENFLSQHNVGAPSFDLNGKDPKEQSCVGTRETEGAGWEKVVSESQSAHKMNINQAQCSADNERNAPGSHDENSTTEYVECDCVFRSDCDCGRSRHFDVEKEHMEAQTPSFTPSKAKSNYSKAGFDSESGDAPINFPVDMDCEADSEKNGSKKPNEDVEKLSSETVVRQDSFPQSKGPLVENDADHVPEGRSNDTPIVEGNVGIDIINEKEKLKETEEYKRAMEEEWALRQQQLKLQAEEAQRLRKRKKTEILRVSNMEKRQKQRLEEVRASQKQDSANLNMKEQFRSEVIKELKVLEMRCFGMASLLRSLGVQVEGGAHPSPQQIHGAYKRDVLKFHPDRTSGSSLKQQVEAEEKFKLICRMKEKYQLR